PSSGQGPQSQGLRPLLFSGTLCPALSRIRTPYPLSNISNDVLSSGGAEPRTASHRLTRSAGLISAATFASRILGLVRDQVQAGFFGTSSAADAFGLATRIPTLLRDL